jgi:RNA polymerase sigma-70 factor (ECF subfamily)
VRQAREGRREAFTALVERYRDLLCGLAYHYLGDREDAQDAAQEAFLYAFRHLQALREPDRFGPWLRRIGQSRCADLLRQRGRRIVEELGSLRSAEPCHDPSSALAARLVVREALARLPEGARLAVTLVYLGGYSHEEVARFLEVPVNTVRSRLQAAKRRLRVELEESMTEMIRENRPDPAFTWRVVEAALAEAAAASAAHAPGEALRHYDAALEALAVLPPDATRQRRQMEVLRDQSKASRFARGFPEAMRLHEQALAIARELGDRQAQAEIRMWLGAHTHDRARSDLEYRGARRLFRALGDGEGEGECLFWMATRALQEGGAVRSARSLYTRALPLLEAAGSHRLAGVSRAALKLLRETGERAFADLPAWNASCDALEARGGAVRCGPHSEIRRGGPGVVSGLVERTLFQHLAPLAPLIDARPAVGDRREGPSWSYTSRPLRTQARVVSVSERLTVPAGRFENCLLIEQSTTEREAPDDAPGENQEANRRSLCGTRRAWFAPGVGLVQLAIRSYDGREACLRLAAFSVDGGEGFLPLASGNTWEYAWAGLPGNLSGRECYRVGPRDGDTWFVESHGCLRG